LSLLTRQAETATVTKVTIAPRQNATTTLRGATCGCSAKPVDPTRAAMIETMPRPTPTPSAMPTTAAPRS